MGKLNWLGQQKRPDIAFEVSYLSQVCKGGDTEDMRRLIRVEERLKRGSVAVELERLEGREVYIEVYADASLGNMRGGKTQIGYVVRLRDGRGNRCLILWKSKVA